MAFQVPAVIRPYRTTYPKIELWLPVVTGLASREAERKINEEIRREAEQLIRDQGSLDDPRAQMIGWFEVKTNEKEVLSLSLFNYAYTGGAHGLTLQRSLTFMTDTGKRYSLAELFKPGSDYVGKLSEQVAAQIKSRDVPVLEPFTRIRADQDFYIADRALVIYFQLYELTPYVYGFPYFPISSYSVQEIVNEEGPLGPMIAND
ncbi:DUF3298 and DUF4163 domain-containing protein [Paenibacillus sp. IB182496]|uniref:DUF3298 and DUF4163 domain-containing protein n=1 Tax=Paenibacillus sabuli TaxID=2772509 RepID=A0A927BWS4_9BACL|nr:DUF3298 and DUF4163 domain-containing protein [Paenibacillus sabuli]MBD2847762.1 DUF3298 and DUF4163 domain-containing protein [Paenibacillus sabuli]